MSTFKQLALDVDQQIDLLKNKSLEIENIDEACYRLSQVRYFRLKKFTYSFKDNDANIINFGNFINNTTFIQAVDLYLFDRELKLIIYDAIEAIGVSLQTKISNTMSSAYGPHWYFQSQYFSSNEDFTHDGFIAKIKDNCDGPDETFIDTLEAPIKLTSLHWSA